MKESRFYRFIKPIIPQFLSPFVLRYQEYLSYLFFGGLTVAVNLILYYALCFFISYLVANVFAWIAAVIFAFVVNKLFVFEADSIAKRNVTYEVFTFFAARLFSLLAEEAVLLIFVEKLEFSNDIVKFFAQILVIALNYFTSKFIVFPSTKYNEL